MIRRRRLASELRRLREAARLTCDETAVRLDCSASKISRIETGHVSASPRDVRDLLRIYGVPEDEHARLIDLARESRQKDWWQRYGDSVGSHLATWLGLESEAAEIWHYNVARIPALLQTRDYNRALVTAAAAGGDRYPGTPDAVAEMVAEYQRVAAVSQPTMRIVLDEAALRRKVGSPAVMRAQIEHLIELSSTETTFLQVIPFSSGAYVCMDLPFVILRFPDPADSGVVFIAYKTGGLWLEDQADISRYHEYFGHLEAAALSLSDSAALMKSILDELPSP